MKDTKQPARVAGGPCPDFESLSCYADSELDPAVTAGVAAHVSGCSHCATLAVRLREGFEADDARRRDGGIGGSGCAGEEELVLYAMGEMNGAERAVLEAHFGGCDACISALTVLHNRLAVAAMVETPVPAGTQQRARRALDAWLPSPAAAEELPRYAPPRISALLSRARALLRVPVLVPAAAIAAGALLTVALQPGRVERPVGEEQGRSIMRDAARMRVTAVEASVRSRPSMQSEVVATVHRGAVVEVAAEERGWYEVRLEGGRPGWVEREAFE
jgi:hypothetical protein